MYQGSIVALVTPLRNGLIDEVALRELVEFQIENGTHGIVPCGCTGESATLTYEEQERVTEIVLETVNKRVPVIAGTGSNSTEEALRLTRHAKKAGADGVLMITPYYNKPTQEGLYRHYTEVASKVDVPIVLYNVPSRTGINMLPATVARLAKMDNVVAIKEASGSLEQMSHIVALCHGDFTLLSGDDSITLPLLSIGGKGVISVAANVAPRDTATLVDEFLAGNHDRAIEMHYKLLPLVEAMFYETNPIPVKTALALMGKISGELRLPLCEMSEANKERLTGVMEEYGLV